MFEEDGEKIIRLVGNEEFAYPEADLPRHGEDVVFKACFNDVPRSSLARVLSHMFVRSVRAPEEAAAERLSETATGTVAELAEKFSLVVE